jgi:hypothetical protein
VELAMPVIYKIDPVRRVIRTTCSDPLTLGEVVEHFKMLSEDPDCAGHLDVLLDLGETRSLPASRQLGAVNTALETVREKVQFNLCAIVAKTDAMFGMMRMFEVLAGRYFGAIRVFRDAAQAEAWLLGQKSAGDSDQ